MATKQNRVGERSINSDGLEMEIVKDEGSHKLTIRFLEDGTEKENVYYRDFVHGLVKKRPRPSELANIRIGEKRQMKDGSWLILREYHGTTKCVFELENGEHITTDYSRFTSGDIGGKIAAKRKKFYFDKTLVSEDGYEFVIVNNISSHQALCRFLLDNYEKKCTWTDIRNNAVRRYTTESDNAVCQHKAEKETVCPIVIGDILTSFAGLKYEILDIHIAARAKDDVEITARCVDTGDVIEKITWRVLKQRKHADFKKYLERKKNDELQSVIGETTTTSWGEIATIVGGVNIDDMTIQYEDGSKREHVSYAQWKSGVRSKTSGNNSGRTEKHKRERLGQIVTSKHGEKGRIVDYKDCTHVTIEMDNGELIETDYWHAIHSVFVTATTSFLNTTSFNEFTLHWFLQKYGFDKAKCGTLQHLGFGKKELDLFSEKYKIAIEYDGPLHDTNKAEKKDNEKDRLAQAAGIRIIRIREKCRLLSNGISTELALNDCHHFSPALNNVFNDLIDIINDWCDLDIGHITFDTQTRQAIIDTFAAKTQLVKKIGEQNYNNQGELMTITAYNSYDDITVEFSNGFVVHKSCYERFKDGRILCKYNHYGETNVNKYGETMTIISNHFGQRVDVQFPNGAIVYAAYYNSFQSGKLLNPSPNPKEDVYLQRLTGQSILCKNGLMATIVNAYREGSYVFIDVEFEDGVIVTRKKYGHFLQGYIKHPTIVTKTPRVDLQQFIGITKLCVNGWTAKVINAYRDGPQSTIFFDLQFEDDTIVYHKSKSHFNSGLIRHPKGKKQNT